MRAPGLPALADWGAGLSIAGLLLPEAVAYSGIAGLPPQAGVIALFAGLLIARPEAPLFFGNADPVFAAIRERLQSLPSPRGVVLSLEDSADLDATSVEALCDFAAQLRQLGVPLALARVKDPVRDLLARVGNPALPPASYAGWSVDDAVRQLQIAA